MGGSPDEVRGSPGWLTQVERERAAKFRREADRRSFVAAHLLVRLCAARLTGTAPADFTLLQRCEIHGLGHGRPFLEQAPHLGVSLSHTDGYVCAAVGEGLVGVDAERVPPGPLDESLARQSLTENERAGVHDNRDLVRLWVRKEALIKRGELTLDTMRKSEPDWTERHLLEWEAPHSVLVAVITDTPARREELPAYP